MSDDKRLDVLSLVAYSRSFSVLLGAGVSLARCLDILAETSDEPLASATRCLQAEVCERERTLSAAMREMPGIFTPMYVAMIRAGEVGGVLDETMQQVADQLEADWADARGTGGECRSLLAPSCKGATICFTDSPPDDKLRILSQYFRALGTMLTAGVPLELGPANALNTAAGIFPAGPEQDALLDILHKVEADGYLKATHFQLPFLPSVALQLVSIGLETGTFNVMCEKIAQLLEYQRRYYLLKQGR